MTDFNDLIGKTLKDIRVSHDKEQIDFETVDGVVYQMYHDQDCCETVSIEDVAGEWSDIIGSPITLATESSSSSDPASLDSYEDSYTWTFYKLATVKGFVDIRWYGSSNGYYSEGVSFYKASERKRYVYD